jgi:nucleosome assembly protein 1-like 1
VDYFTGKALEFEVDDDDEFDDDDEEEEEDEDGGSSGSVQDSESDGYVPARARGPLKGRRPAVAGANTNPEECKQQ